MPAHFPIPPACQGYVPTRRASVRVTRPVSYSCLIRTTTTIIYPLSLHDALPISSLLDRRPHGGRRTAARQAGERRARPDRKSTRLNSSHTVISYAVFCLKKKKPAHVPVPPAWQGYGPTRRARVRVTRPVS